MANTRLRARLSELRLDPSSAERLAEDLERLLEGAPAAARSALPELLGRLLETEFTRATHDTALTGRMGMSDTWVASAEAPRGRATRYGEEAPAARPLEPARAVAALAASERYEDLGFLGEGGMGEVRRVLDRALGRTVALKRIRVSLRDSQEVAARFTEEAQICAQLQHPGIIPIYDYGQLPDGRLYFTMEEIEGEELSAKIRRFHADAGRRVRSGDTPGLRRLLDVFQRVCKAVAYAHARGVIHRDLKPNNVMIGSAGQVRVVDWGVAKALDSSPVVVELDAEEAARSAAEGLGRLTGTPTYMAPEQLRGLHDAIDARTDVYALGLILYELLTGAPPGGVGVSWNELIERTYSEIPSPADAVGDRVLPAPLVDICRRALRREQDERFQHAGELARAVSGWLEGARQREHARGLVTESAELEARAATLRERAVTRRAGASARLQEIPPWADETARHSLWRELDAATQLEREAARCRFEGEQRLHTALSLAPGLEEAHAALAERHAREHAACEARGRVDEAAVAELYVRTHADALPRGSPVRARLTAYLKAEGTLALTTEPPAATIEVHRFETESRRLVEGSALGPTLRAPLRARALPIGSYSLRVSAPGRASVRYPVVITRGEVWSMTPPGADQPAPLWLPPAGALSERDVYVPGGWFRAGGDPSALNGLPGCRLWIDGFVIRRAPVTNREYVEFINHQLAAGPEAAAVAARALPMIDPGSSKPTPVYRRGADGRYHCTEEAPPEFPVVHIDWSSARAFCRWLAAREDRPWRLPDELEWEKAARGVDGRLFPWGSWLDTSRCNNRDAHPTPRLVSNENFPVDESPYGVVGMAGNSMDWCANTFIAPEKFDISPRRVAPARPGDDADASAARLYRGGSWSYNVQLCRLARRFRHTPSRRVDDLGVRPVYSVDELRDRG